MSSDADPFLDSLFARARQSPPSAQQLAWFLRAAAPPRRRPWAGVAAAAALALLLLISVSAPQPAFAWTRVVTALRSAPVIHARAADGDQLWLVRDAFRAERCDDGRLLRFWDYAAEEEAIYRAGRRVVLRSTREPGLPGPDLTGPYTLEELVQNNRRWGRELDEAFELEEEQRSDGRVYRLVATNPDSYASEYLIDAETHRVLGGRAGGRTFEVSYPDDAPRSLVDLGLPPNTPVIDGRAPAPLFELRARVRAARSAGFGACHAVVAATHGDLWYHVLQDGDNVRALGFDPGIDDRVDPVVAEQRAREFLDDPSAIAALSVEVCDGVMVRAVFRAGDGEWGPVDVRPAGFGVVWTRTLAGRCWQNTGFFHPWPERQDEYLPGAAGELPGWRARGQANGVSRPWMMSHRFDPEHGHRLAEITSWDDPAAPWQIAEAWQEEYEAYVGAVVRPAADDPPDGFCYRVLEWAELRPGAWYPSLAEHVPMVGRPDGAHPDPNAPAWHTVVVAAPLEGVPEEAFRLPGP